MNKQRKIMIAVILTIVSLLAITTGVFAWFIATKDINFVKINNGEMTSISVIKHKEEIVDTRVEIDDLVFIDFNNDVIEDKYSMLDRMASSLYIKISVGNDSIPLKNKISLEIKNSLEAANGLLYLVIIEGVNVDTITTSYHNFLGDLEASDLTLLKDNVSYTDNDTYVAREVLWRETIEKHNEDSLDEIYNTILEAEDYIGIQIVFWGDYDKLPEDDQKKLIGDERDKNIRIKFDVVLTIDTIQAKGDL